MNVKNLIIKSVGLTNTKLLKTHRPAFITLTYADKDDTTHASGEEWQPRHISDFIKNIRTYVQRQLNDNKYKLTTVWTAEKNKNRPYIHYHLVVWLPKRKKLNGKIGKKHIKLPKPDKRGWWKHGWSNIQWAYNPAIYLAKYLAKDADNDFITDSGARRYAINVKHVVNLDFYRIPDWLSYFCRQHHVVKRVKGYGWVNQTTGKCYDSPYKFNKDTGLEWIGFKRCGYELDFYDDWLISIGSSPKEQEAKERHAIHNENEKAFFDFSQLEYERNKQRLSM